MLALLTAASAATTIIMIYSLLFDQPSKPLFLVGCFLILLTTIFLTRRNQ